MEMDAAVVAQIVAQDSSYAAFYKSIPEKPEMVMCYDPKGVDIYNEQLLANKREAEKAVSKPEPTEPLAGVPDMEPEPRIEPTPEAAPTPVVIPEEAPANVKHRKDKRKQKHPRN